MAQTCETWNSPMRYRGEGEGGVNIVISPPVEKFWRRVLSSWAWWTGWRRWWSGWSRRQHTSTARRFHTETLYVLDIFKGNILIVIILVQPWIYVHYTIYIHNERKSKLDVCIISELLKAFDNRYLVKTPPTRNSVPLL